ncbi:CRAL/TRIO domain-containing protein [Pluteus cervinus]|uniref:CRAL/TRIO domain-containing protein n=1 Tax=Pluteus cervinus TaxID=181527 RepID=A0ACD3BBJ7_9AGAR|nr:CRAL/TRIO domain-containing protein [Pluteus cervinus]
MSEPAPVAAIPASEVAQNPTTEPPPYADAEPAEAPSTREVSAVEQKEEAIPTTSTGPAAGIPPADNSGPSVPAEAPPTEKPEDTPEEMEQQTPLTRHFTPAEWAALKEFRKELPAALKDAYPERENAETTPFTLYGVTIDPLKPAEDPRVSVILMKFLRARNLHHGEARVMLVATLRWREEFDVEAALKEEFPEGVFGKVGHVFGEDREGRPVVYNLYGGNKDLKAVFGDVQRFLRWRVALMERCVRQLDFLEIDQTVQVHDYEGVSLTSRDANSKQAASEATSIFQNHYPEFLHRKFFINVPTLLNWIFWAFKPLISANTLAKMSVVGTGKHAISRALLPVIPAENLPQRYGGDAVAF